MNTEDQNIKSFFDDMRQEDLKNKTPDFEEVLPQKKKSKLRYSIPVSIAACLIVGIGIWNKTPEIEPEENTVVITIENKTTTETLLSEDLSDFSWDSSTASLINDFND